VLGERILPVYGRECQNAVDMIEMGYSEKWQFIASLQIGHHRPADDDDHMISLIAFNPFIPSIGM
jgi:hypothetical protein